MTERIALIVPIYNGDKYLDSTIQELEVFFAMNVGNIVIMVDDGSSDGTWDRLEQIENPKIKCIHLTENIGKGGAVCIGIQSIDTDKFDIIGFTDVELPYGLSQLSEVISLVSGGVDVVVGERGGGLCYSRYRLWMKNLFRLFLPPSVRAIPDTQCGFKFFRSDVVREVFSGMSTTRWVFDIEIILRVKKNHLKLVSVPVEIKPSCVDGSGGVSLYRHGFTIVRDILRLRRMYD